MKQCTGCGRYDNEPIGLNNNGNPYLACCPDNNYVEVITVKLYDDLQISQSLRHYNISESKISKIISFMEPIELPFDGEVYNMLTGNEGNAIEEQILNQNK